MDINSKYNLLKACSLFNDCDEDTIYSIAADTYHRVYKKGEVVLSGDATLHKISILVNKGRMKVFTFNPVNAEEYIVYLLSHGDIFNIITLFDGKKDNLSAMAIDRLEVLHCNLEMARAWITNYPAFNKNLLVYLSNRLRIVMDYNISKTFFNIELRLAQLIFQNISDDDGKLNLINDLSHNEIAKLIGTTRTVVNRNLQKLKKEGVIEISYKQILIKNYTKLKEIISDYEGV